MKQENPAARLESPAFRRGEEVTCAPNPAHSHPEGPKVTSTGHPLGTPEDVIARLAQARHRQHRSQADVAKQIGTVGHHISQIETGRQNPTLRTLTRYAQALGHIIAVIPTPQGKPTSDPQSPESPRPPK